MLYKGSEVICYDEMSDHAIYSDLSRKSCFVLPGDLAGGWYLADFRTALDGREYVVQRMIQVSNISVYAGILPSQAAFFINDAATGEALVNADITLYTDTSSYKGKTDGGGAALLDYSAERGNYGILEIRAGDRVYYDRIRCAADRELSMREKYSAFVYTDRLAYLPDDTVRVWGVIRPRRTDVEIPEKLSLAFGISSGDGIFTEADVADDGSFAASFDISKYKSMTDRCIYIVDGEDFMYGKSILIMPYEKPLYVIEPVVPDYFWLPQENPATIGVYVKYFDGTPAAGRKVKINYDTTVETDADGYAECNIKLSDTGRYAGADGTVACCFEQSICELTGVEDERQFTEFSYFSFYRDAQLECVSKESGELSSVELEAYEINTDNFTVQHYDADNWSGYSVYDRESVKGAPYSVTATAKLVRSWWEEIYKGTKYDHIQKKIVPYYEYKLKKETVGSYSVEIKDGKGRLDGIPTPSDNCRYSLEVSCTDRGGRLMSATILFGAQKAVRPGVHKYSVCCDGAPDRSFKYGETAEFRLCDNYEEIEDFSGRIFYIFYRDGIIKTGVTAENSFKLRMSDEYIPNVGIAAAYFDGKHVYGSTKRYISFDPQEREIKLDVVADKESYAPADTVEVTVTARSVNGEPVPGAHVLLSAVDEAALAVLPSKNTAKPLEGLYGAFITRELSSYCSYKEHSLNGEMMEDDGNYVTGGGGVPEIRSEFADTAYFADEIADSSGVAKFTFKLPDNVTSWIITTVAVGELGDGLYAGADRIKRAAAIPVFITAIMPDEYAEGDDIAFSARCAGAADAVITAEVNGENYSKKLSADRNGEFNFGKLPLGSYTVLYRAESANGSDALLLPFNVVSSRLTAELTRVFDLSAEKVDISPVAYPVTLNFVNKDAELYSETVNSLSGCRGGNLDYALSFAFAMSEYGYAAAEDLVSMVRGATEDGLASLYSYADGDTELTALICAAFPEYVDKGAVTGSLYRTLRPWEGNCESADAASCYMGLAALGEPVLNEIDALLRGDGYFSYDSRLKLCAGLAMLGDAGRALEHYRALTGNMTVYRDESGRVYAYVKERDSAGEDEIQGSTRLALISAAALRLPEAEGMARWLNSQKHREYGCALERAAFLRYYRPVISSDAQVSFTVNGEEHVIIPDKFYGCSVSLGEEQLKNANIRLLSGNVICTAVYEGRPSELDGSGTLKVSKKIELSEGESEMPGALYKVTVTVSGAAGDTCTVRDVIPSCARFAGVSAQRKSNGSVAVRHNSGQQVVLDLYKCREAVYYIYRVTNGESVIEPPFASDFQNNRGNGTRSVMPIVN